MFPIPNPPPSSLPIPSLWVVRPCAPAPSIQYRASNLDWQLVSYMIFYMFQCLLHCWWECKLVQPLWRTVWRFLKKLEIDLTYYPAIPVFLPREFHGWRSLVGYSPWGQEELDTTERLHDAFMGPILSVNVF